MPNGSAVVFAIAIPVSNAVTELTNGYSSVVWQSTTLKIVDDIDGGVNRGIRPLGRRLEKVGAKLMLTVPTGVVGGVLVAGLPVYE